MLTLPEIARSRYLLHRGLCDAGFPAIRAALAVDVLLGPEPSEDDVVGGPLEWRPELEPEFEPDPEDLGDYLDWSDRLELSPRPAEYPGLFTDADLAAAGLAVG